MGCLNKQGFFGMDNDDDLRIQMPNLQSQIRDAGPEAARRRNHGMPGVRPARAGSEGHLQQFPELANRFVAFPIRTESGLSLR